MTDAEKPDLPPCGLYRTGLALGPDKVEAKRLVMFHNHSEQGLPIILLPENNTDNRWAFHSQGYLVRDESFVDALEPMLAEGFYILEKHIHISQAEIVPEQTLVQLGYNRQAEPILFVGRFDEGNTIRFPARGLRFDDAGIFDRLRPAGFRIPARPEILH